MSTDHTHLVNNGKRDLTIDELAKQQPGMDRLMAEVGPRVHRMYYAAQVGNWPLAAYFCKSVVKQLKLSVESRPKYDPEMTDYLRDDYGPVSAAIKAQDGETLALPMELISHHAETSGTTGVPKCMPSRRGRPNAAVLRTT